MPRSFDFSGILLSVYGLVSSSSTYQLHSGEVGQPGEGVSGDLADPVIVQQDHLQAETEMGNKIQRSDQALTTEVTEATFHL